MTLLLGIAMAFAATGPLRAEAGRGAAPLEPPDESVSGSTPVFVVTYDGLSENELRQARFRIRLSSDGFRSADYVFDQRERRTGWVPGEPGRVLYRPRVPLDDGDYEWRASLWNGLRWVEGVATHRLRIDTIPPEPVGQLAVAPQPGGRGLVLSWSPVVLDRDGGPEYVARYHVYRYVGPGPYPYARAFVTGETAGLRWVDEDPPAAPPLVLYRISAEDTAGNSAATRTGFERP